MKKPLLLRCIYALPALFFIAGCSSKLAQNTMSPMPPSGAMAKRVSAPPEITAPAHIALLLPLDGKLAATSEAFRDGFLDAYYADKKSSRMNTTITVLNTRSENNIVAVYQEALNKGATFIVGPLTKSGVAALSASDVVSVPTLALNKTPEQNNHSDNLYYYSLSPEDEAIHVAQFARKRGQSTALIFAENGEWGDRTAKAFAHQWKQLGGQVVAITHYQSRENMDVFVRKALQVNAIPSAKDKDRSIYISRKDVDAVFIAGHVEAAQQIRPLVSFYSGNKLPVYGTASLYTKSQTPIQQRDIDGIIFCDIPWVIDPNSTYVSGTLRTELGEVWNNTPVDFSRLYAMGVDAYGISKQLNKKSFFTRFSYPGTTGYLTLGSKQNIQRELLCAKIEHGRARVVR